MFSSLSQELAKYEDSENEVTLTEKGELSICACTHRHRRVVQRLTLNTHVPAELLEDGFGDTPFYHCIITEIPGESATDGTMLLI